MLVQHFMLGPGWEQGCPSCSFMADHIQGMNVHLARRDVTLLVASRAPLAEIERFRRHEPASTAAAAAACCHANA